MSYQEIWAQLYKINYINKAIEYYTQKHYQFFVEKVGGTVAKSPPIVSVKDIRTFDFTHTRKLNDFVMLMML